MKNYWLEQHNKLDSLIIRRCKDAKAADDLCKKFMALSETIINHLGGKLYYCGFDKEEIAQDCTMMCYEKLDRYEQARPHKGKAEYYFAIIIESFLRQMFRSYKNEKYKELKQIHENKN